MIVLATLAFTPAFSSPAALTSDVAARAVSLPAQGRGVLLLLLLLLTDCVTIVRVVGGGSLLWLCRIIVEFFSLDKVSGDLISELGRGIHCIGQTPFSALASPTR